MTILTSNLKYIIEVNGEEKRLWPVSLYYLCKKSVYSFKPETRKEFFNLFREEDKKFFNNKEGYVQYLKDRDYYLGKDKEQNK